MYARRSILESHSYTHTNKISITTRECSIINSCIEIKYKNKYSKHRCVSPRIVFFICSCTCTQTPWVRAIEKATIDLNQSSIWASSSSYSKKVQSFQSLFKSLRILFIHFTHECICIWLCKFVCVFFCTQQTCQSWCDQKCKIALYFV